MSKKFLVTGGSGFIGSALVLKLIDKGFNVRVLDNNSRGSARRLKKVESDIEFVEGDIRDPDVVYKALKNIDCVCHLAYVNGTEFFYSKPELVLDVAIRGMINIIDSCRRNNIKDLVVASSSEVYQSPSIIPTPEDVSLIVPDVFNPRYSYGGGKILCELMALNYGKKDFERVTIFRPHNVYGPDMGWEHVIPEFALKMFELLKKGNSTNDFKIKGNGKQTRAFIYIDDFVDGLLKVIDNAEHLSIYHIGTQEEITINELAKKIAAIVNLDINLIESDAPKGETNRRCPDISKLNKLNFNPKISIFEGLKNTIPWYLENVNLR